MRSFARLSLLMLLASFAACGGATSPSETTGPNDEKPLAEQLGASLHRVQMGQADAASAASLELADQETATAVQVTAEKMRPEIVNCQEKTDTLFQCRSHMANGGRLTWDVLLDRKRCWKAVIAAVNGAASEVGGRPLRACIGKERTTISAMRQRAEHVAQAGTSDPLEPRSSCQSWNDAVNGDKQRFLRDYEEQVAGVSVGDFIDGSCEGLGSLASQMTLGGLLEELGLAPVNPSTPSLAGRPEKDVSCGSGGCFQDGESVEPVTENEPCADEGRVWRRVEVGSYRCTAPENAPMP